MDINTVKAYMRVDHDDDDEIISLMMDVAAEYIVNAVGVFDESKSRARMLFLAAVEDLYDNRTLVSTSAQGYSVSDKFRHLNESIVAQLQVEELMEAEGNGI